MTDTARDLALRQLIETLGLLGKIEFLSGEGSALLDPTMEVHVRVVAPDDADEVSLTLHAHLLNACRSQGLKAGVNTFANLFANTWYGEDKYDRKIALLISWADQRWLEKMATVMSEVASSDNPDVAARAAWHRDLLRLCQAEGIKTGAARHAETAGLAPPPPADQGGDGVPDMRGLLEELRSYSEDDRPEKWPRLVEIVEILLAALVTSDDPELAALRAQLSNLLGVTLQRLLDAGMIHHEARQKTHNRAHALFFEALQIYRQLAQWAEVATIAYYQANLLQSEFEAGDAGAAPRAHALYDEALAIHRRLKRRVDVAQTAQNKANLLAHEFAAGDAGAAARAHALYDEALGIRGQDLERDADLSQTAQNKANLLAREFEAGDAGAAARAHVLYDEALAIRRGLERWADVATTAQNKANLLVSEFRAGDTESAARAHALYDEALVIRRRLKREVEAGQTAQNLAGLLAGQFEAGDTGASVRAHALFDEALEISRRFERWVDVAGTAANKANLLALEFAAGDTGAAARAHALYDEALEIRRRLGRWIEVASSAQNKANLLSSECEAGSAGAAPRAHALFDEALEIFRHLGSRVDVARCAHNKANLLQRECEIEDVDAVALAHMLYDEALYIFRSLGRQVEVAEAAQNKAYLLKRQFDAGDTGAAASAHKLFDQALEVHRRLQREVPVAGAAQNKANLLVSEFAAGDAGAAAQAHALYDEALAISHHLQRWVDVAQTTQNKAALLQREYEAGDASAAPRAHALYDEAGALLPFEVRAIDNLRIRRNRLSLQVTQGDHQGVVERATAMQADVRRRLPTLGALANRRRLLQALRGVSERACAASLALGDVAQAVVFLENGRTVELGMRLRDAEARLSENERTSLQTSRIDLQTARAAHQRALDRLSLQSDPSGGLQRLAQETEEQLAGSNRAFEALRQALRLAIAVEPPSPDVLLDALGANAALVQIWVGPGSGGALFLGPGSADWQVLDLPALSEAAVDALLSDWFRAYGRFRSDLFGVALDEAAARFSPGIEAGCTALWTMFMGPLHTALSSMGLAPADGADRAPEVVICPPGLLSVLPLHAALDPSTRRPFVTDYAVRTVPSLGSFLTSMARASSREVTAGHLVAVTNPQDDLAMLETGKVIPITRNPAADFFDEAARIDLQGYKGRADTPDVATRERFEAEIDRRRPSCISVYCHGGWSPGRSDNSAIFLAAPTEDDGSLPRDGRRTRAEALPASRIRELPLSECRLFILAGCETGMIDVNQVPDEFVGLPAAALEAGAAATLASLWPVETAGTYGMIRRTLADQVERGGSLAQSVRRAQLVLRDDPQAFSGLGRTLGPASPDQHPVLDRITCPRPPYLWAAFALSGA